MQIKEVKFTEDEKQRFLNYLKEQKDNLDSNITTLNREKVIINQLKDLTPIEAPPDWQKSVVKRIEDYENRINKCTESIDIIKILACTIEDKQELKVEATIFDILNTLYSREKSTKKVNIENKYRFYPRLKKAKEQAMYVFASKIQIIMESKNVRFA